MSSTNSDTRIEKRTKNKNDPIHHDSEETIELNVEVSPSIHETPQRETRKRKKDAETAIQQFKSKETERIMKKVKRPTQLSQSKKSPRKGKEIVVSKQKKTQPKKGKAIQTVIAKEDCKKKGMRQIKSELECLKIRTCPKVLCELISSLNPTQMSVVVQMGFEELLQWDIKEISQRLSYWLIENFLPNSSSIQISEGKLINIKVVDVQILLGLKGEKTITGIKRPLNNPLVKEFLEQFSTIDEKTGKRIVPDPKNVTPAKLAQKIKECEKPDDWFRKNFVILFSTQVVECCTCGGVNITLLDSIEDTSTIKQLDWPSYIMDVLIKTSDIWQQKKLDSPKSNPIFKGPILVPLMAYVDRIVLRNIETPRAAPIIKHWNTKSLRERETNEIKYGGFGQGHLREPVEILYSTSRRSPSVSMSDSSEVQSSKKRKTASTQLETDNLLIFLKNHIDEGKVLAQGIGKYLDRLKTPEGLQLQSNGIFCKVNEAIDEMLKINITSSSSQKSNESEETMSQQLFWDKACRCIEEIEKTKRLKEEMDIYDPLKSFEKLVPDFSPIRTPILPRAGIATISRNLAQKTGQIANDPVAMKDTEFNSVMDNIVVELNSSEETENVPIGNRERETREKEPIVEEENVTVDKEVENANIVEKEKETVVVEKEKEQMKKGDEEALNKEVEEPANAGIEGEEKQLESAGTVAEKDCENIENAETEVAKPVEQEERNAETEVAKPVEKEDRVPLTDQPLSSMKPIAEKTQKATKKVIFAEDEKIESQNPENVTKRVQKPSSKAKSPAKQRQVSLKQPTPAEKYCYNWLLSDKCPEREVIFQMHGVKSVKKDFETFKTDTWITDNIIDIWGQMLNYSEIYKSDEKPLRHFFDVLISTFNMKADEADAKTRCEWFWNMYEDYENRVKLNINKPDLFIFPMWSSEHFYVIAINVKNPRFDILDNSLTDQTMEERYKNIPQDLRAFFINVLEKKGLHSKAEPFKDESKVPTTRLEMPWRTDKNHQDCGIYAMRHMETYFGQGLEGFDCGLEKDNKEQLNILRVKYLHYMLQGQWNEVKYNVQKKIAATKPRKR